MKSVVPVGFVIGVRLSGDEEIPGGMDIDDCVRIAENLADLGIDYFSITHGTRGKYVKDSTGEDAVAIPPQPGFVPRQAWPRLSDNGFAMPPPPTTPSNRGTPTWSVWPEL